MTMKAAENICEYQGIKMKKEVKVYCPACGRKTLILNVTDNEAYCIRCNKHYKSIEEVERLEEEKFHDDHEAFEYMMQERSSAQK